MNPSANQYNQAFNQNASNEAIANFFSEPPTNVITLISPTKSINSDKCPWSPLSLNFQQFTD